MELHLSLTKQPYLGEGAWAPASLSGMLFAGSGRVAGWTGDKVVVWGGGNGNVLNTGGFTTS